MKKKKTQGTILMRVTKGAAMRQFNILPVSEQMGGKHNDRTQMKSYKQLTLTSGHQADHPWRHGPVCSEHSSTEEALTMAATSLKNKLPYQSACECFRLQ